MTGYILRRLLSGAVNIFLVSIFVAGVLRLLPGDAADVRVGEHGSADPQVLAAMREEIGLNDPFIIQYRDWLFGLVRGDLGTSFLTREEIAPRVGRALPPTIELTVLATVISLLIGFPLGLSSAVWRGSIIDHVSRLFAVAGVAVPSFWIATLLLIYPALWFGWTPPLQYVEIWKEPWTNLELMLGAALVLGWSFAAGIARMVRSSTLEVLRQDYVRTARAKGVRNASVILRHAFPNGLLPVVSIVGTEIAILFGGTVIIEQIFGVPGIGRLTYDAITTRDYPQVQASVLLFSTALVLINLITDLAYGWIDPRVRVA